MVDSYKCKLVNSTELDYYGVVTDVAKNPWSAVVGNGGKKSIFPGKFDRCKLGMYIKEVMYNKPYVIVFWSDGTKTMSKCQEGDKYNREFGLTLCIMKKLVGGDQVANVLKEWVPEDSKVKRVDLKYLREKAKVKVENKDGSENS